MFPLIKLAKKLKEEAGPVYEQEVNMFPLIKLAKKLKDQMKNIASSVLTAVSIN